MLLEVHHQGPTPNYQRRKGSRLSCFAIWHWNIASYKDRMQRDDLSDETTPGIDWRTGNNRLATIAGLHSQNLDQIKRWNGHEVTRHEIARHDAGIHERTKEHCQFRGGTQQYAPGTDVSPTKGSTRLPRDMPPFPIPRVCSLRCFYPCISPSLDGRPWQSCPCSWRGEPLCCSIHPIPKIVYEPCARTWAPG